MKEDKSSNKASSEIKFVDKGALESTWRRVVKRRSFLHGLSAAAATVPAAAIFAAERDPDRDRDEKPLTRGDVSILRLVAAVELIEADLWQQYNELEARSITTTTLIPGIRPTSPHLQILILTCRNTSPTTLTMRSVTPPF